MSQTIIPITIDHLPSRALFEAAPPETLYHYTNLDGASGILSSGSLWLSKFTTTNDSSELHFAFTLFKGTVDQAIARLPSDEANFMVSAARQLDSFRRTNVCVASFCEHPDLLSQWRAYGNDGKGLALGFDARELGALARDHQLRLVKCVYSQQLHSRIIGELVEMLVQSYRVARPRDEAQARDLIGYFNSTFLLVAPVLKPHHFLEEAEWRLVSMPRSIEDPNLTAVLRGNRASIKFSLPFGRLRRGLIPRVVVGPGPDAANVADALDVFAERHGFHFSSIAFSQISYRSN